MADPPQPAAEVRSRLKKHNYALISEPTEQPDLALLREHGFHVHSTSAAMKVEMSVASRASARHRYTVAIEIARATGPRTYDWAHKLIFQFTASELPRLGAMLLGYSPGSLTLANHGPAADKFLEVVDQGSKLFVKLRQGADTRGIPVQAGHVHAWASLVLVALRMNDPAIDGAAQMELLRRVGRMGTGS